MRREEHRGITEEIRKLDPKILVERIKKADKIDDIFGRELTPKERKEAEDALASRLDELKEVTKPANEALSDVSAPDVARQGAILNPEDQGAVATETDSGSPAEAPPSEVVEEKGPVNPWESIIMGEGEVVQESPKTTPAEPTNGTPTSEGENPVLNETTSAEAGATETSSTDISAKKRQTQEIKPETHDESTGGNNAEITKRGIAGVFRGAVGLVGGYVGTSFALQAVSSLVPASQGFLVSAGDMVCLVGAVVGAIYLSRVGKHES